MKLKKNLHATSTITATGKEHLHKANLERLCSRSESFGCMFDRWTYYFKIQTVDSLPEGFTEVRTLYKVFVDWLLQLFTGRLDQLNKYLVKMYDSSNADESLQEILHTTLPKFNCPFGYKDVVMPQTPLCLVAICVLLLGLQVCGGHFCSRASQIVLQHEIHLRERLRHRQSLSSVNRKQCLRMHGIRPADPVRTLRGRKGET